MLENRRVGDRITYIKGKSDVGLFVRIDSPKYQENLEEGIKELVNLLNDRFYPTISSCQGHGLELNRRVAICFPNKEKLEKFKELIKKSKIPYLEVYSFEPKDFYSIDGKENKEAKKQLRNSLEIDWEVEYIGYLNFEHSTIRDNGNWLKTTKLVILKSIRQIFYLEKDYINLINYLKENLLPMDFL